MQISFDMQMAMSVASESSAFRRGSTKGGQHKIPIYVDEHIFVSWVLPKKAETYLFREGWTVFLRWDSNCAALLPGAISVETRLRDPVCEVEDISEAVFRRNR